MPLRRPPLGNFGEADHRAADRLHRAGGVASRGGLRPDETREGVEQRLTGDETAEQDERLRCVGPGIGTVQGRASIEFLVRAFGPESPGIGYAPLESRTKRWAPESPIEGWFPPLGGERTGCDRTRSLVPPRDRATLEPSTSLRERPFRAPQTTDAGRQNSIGQRVVEVRLDGLPHRRKFKGPFAAGRRGRTGQGVMTRETGGDERRGADAGCTMRRARRRRSARRNGPQGSGDGRGRSWEENPTAGGTQEPQGSKSSGRDWSTEVAKEALQDDRLHVADAIGRHNGPWRSHGPGCRTRGSPGSRARPTPVVRSPWGRTRPLGPRRSRGDAARPDTEPSESGAEDGRRCPGGRARRGRWSHADEAGFVAWQPASLEAPWRRLESTFGRRHGRSGHQTMPRHRIEVGQSARCPARAI